MISPFKGSLNSSTLVLQTFDGVLDQAVIDRNVIEWTHLPSPDLCDTEINYYNIFEILKSLLVCFFVLKVVFTCSMFFFLYRDFSNTTRNY